MCILRCGHAKAKIVGQQRIKRRGHGMPFHLRRIRNVRASRLAGVLFLALLIWLPVDAGVATAQEVKQIKLTEKQVQGFIAAHPDMAKLYDGANPQKPDPKVEAQAAAIAKKNGFASLAEHAVVTMNVAMIMSGIDPQTKGFTEPPEQIRKEIATVRSDKSVPEPQKKQILAQLELALKNAKPIQFKENIALVLKYFDKLPPLMQPQQPAH
jgi:hypothetical protein